MELIDKAAVVAEIEKRISLFIKEKKIEKYNTWVSQMNVVSLGARIAMLKEILSFLNTLEVKEVNLERRHENNMTDKKRIVAEIKRLQNEWRYHSSTEAKYRCEAYIELLEWVYTRLEELASENSEEAELGINQTQKEKQ